MNKAPRKQITTVGQLPVEIVRKKIKHLYIRIYPPDARVVVSAPVSMGLESIRLALNKRLEWISGKRAAIISRRDKRETLSSLLYLPGEEHAFLGQNYQLSLQSSRGKGRVSLNTKQLTLHLKSGASYQEREKTLADWYRSQLQELLSGLLAKWEPLIGVKTTECRIRRMKTRWGSCNTKARRIWLNLELAKKPLSCIEYVLVHELVHLHERLHNQRFYALMDRYYPDWRDARKRLNEDL